MIQLRSDCLVFETPDGQGIPCAAEEVAVKLLGPAFSQTDTEILRNAAIAVLYFFKNELGRKTVTVSEFSRALEQVLRGFGLHFEMTASLEVRVQNPQMVDSDLRGLAAESGKGCELFFFPRLRRELHRQMEKAPALVRFSGLRGCVKQLLGARRWTPSCQRLSDQIVHYLRGCLSTENRRGASALVVTCAPAARPGANWQAGFG